MPDPVTQDEECPCRLCRPPAHYDPEWHAEYENWCDHIRKLRIEEED